jgi:hypothetical protein
MAKERGHPICRRGLHNTLQQDVALTAGSGIMHSEADGGSSCFLQAAIKSKKWATVYADLGLLADR